MNLLLLISNLILDCWNERQGQILPSFDNGSVLRKYADDVFLFIPQHIVDVLFPYLCIFLMCNTISWFMKFGMKALEIGVF